AHSDSTAIARNNRDASATRRELPINSFVVCTVHLSKFMPPVALRLQVGHVIKHQINGRAVRPARVKCGIEGRGPRHLSARESFEETTVDQNLGTRHQATHESS